MLTFILNDTLGKEFIIEYITDSFFGIKNSITLDNVEEEIRKLSINDLENLIELLNNYILEKHYREKDKDNVKTIYDIAYNLRYNIEKDIVK